MRRSSTSFSFFVCVLIAACDCGGGSGDDCTTTADCPAGSVCVDGTCITRDSGPMGDTGGDTGPVEICLDNDRDGHDGMTVDCARGTDCDDRNSGANPDAGEICGNGTDDDCDGSTDESDCECRRGDRVGCYSGAAGTAGVGICRRGVALCVDDGVAGECRGEVVPAAAEETECDGVDEDCDGSTDEGLRNACGVCGDEVAEACGNDLDDDCDGMTDEGCNCDYRCMCEDGTDCECRPPTNQPCYEGPFGTEGRGVCAGGRRDCIVDAATGENNWGMCAGQVTPGTECEGGAADGDDDDCDGRVDEGCRDDDGDGSPWPSDCDDSDPDVRPGAAESCNDVDDDCDGVFDEGVRNACGGCGMPAASEECGNGLDDDCNGLADDGCSCTTGETGTCYTGPADTLNVGACRAGMHTCEGGEEFPAFGACMGSVVPQPEVCNGEDDDCDGNIDERGAIGSNACGFCDPTEICDGEDQDCDGLTDEGVSNSCGECGDEPVEVCNGTDDDCDAVIDEGVANACGTCEPEPCFTDTWDTPADCDDMGRTCDDLEEHPDFPGSVTLGQSTVDFDYIYLAVTARNEVAQLDTMTGAVNWIVPSHGVRPSRTAVAEDGSVWVSNRAIGGNPADVNQSNVVHLSAADGSLICRAPVLNIARSVAIDADGNIWAGSYNTGTLYHISGTEVDGSTSPPTCRVLRTVETGRNIYGLTADPDGFVWTSSSPTVRVSVADYSMTTVTNPSHYGIAPDGMNRIWFGGWIGGANVHAINRTDFSITDTGVNQVTAVTVHPDGSVWGSGYGVNQLIGFNSDGTLRCRGAIPSGTNPHGVAVDRMGRIWVPSRFGSGTVNVFDTSCMHLATYTVSAGQEIYSYSDMTGHLLRAFVNPEGTWTQIFDSGYATPYWTNVEWDSTEPPDTGIEISVRSADTEAGLAGATPCGPFSPSPADLSTCPPDLHRHRYLQVDARLFRSGSATERPVLHEVRANWAY